MLTHHSIHFTGNLNLVDRVQSLTSATGIAIMNTPLSCAEPLLVADLMLDAGQGVPTQTYIVLTFKQRMQIDMFLAPLQTWTVGTATPDASWQVASCFVPRLHRNGDIDFVAPYLAGSQALALIAAHPIVNFRVSDREGERWLEGRAQIEIVQRSWEYDDLRAYLEWRIPEATDGLSGEIEVVVFRPIYLRYCDRLSDNSFEVKS